MKPIKRWYYLKDGTGMEVFPYGKFVEYADMMERVKALKEKIMKQKETYVKEGYDAGSNDGLMCSIRLLEKYFPEEDET
jgi:hypothetical protein|tara:strand:- start:116 stop:352 length:237 start_codon:yes stop_codon:yes gene_type:complete